MLAGALCIELIGIRDALQDALPIGGFGRALARASYCGEPVSGGEGGGARGGAPRARASYSKAPVREDYSVPSPLPHLPAHTSDNLLQGTAGLVYRGLANSGGISYFEAAVQARLHMFYDHAGRAEYDMVEEMATPLVRDVALFRDANAPFALSSLAHLPRLRRTGRQGTGRHGTMAGSLGG